MKNMTVVILPGGLCREVASRGGSTVYVSYAHLPPVGNSLGLTHKRPPSFRYTSHGHRYMAYPALMER